ncbi:UBC-like protein [Gonapodya prolifera JEL478]|uniref:Ubiquitin-conjugating enzyme E2 6 n=1 Tax=Gonapodya prolifera (strain JEL478) TaxID=1344416 RepID=A0A139AEX9_GONPJ|nr:UBC-like protein [Gonapodya prolifera JEL478]|eukprot:KXS15337.1 UBC-like protein [Gonapodya prolifera JEL478]
MATKAAYKRLTKEYVSIQQNPPPYIVAKPLESNILEWHYVITGPPDSPFAGGEYHGRLIFPTEYPFKPPAIKIITPNGRFQTDFRLCLTMSDYHPNTWNPAWSVSTILTGLLSFMLEETPTTGSIETSRAEKVALAHKSRRWNRENGGGGHRNTRFKEIWPELCGTENYHATVIHNESAPIAHFNGTNGNSIATPGRGFTAAAEHPQPTAFQTSPFGIAPRPQSGLRQRAPVASSNVISAGAPRDVAPDANPATGIPGTGNPATCLQRFRQWFIEHRTLTAVIFVTIAIVFLSLMVHSE